jgi:uncharacterized protein YbjT (DUF2867 family)
VTRIAVTGGTGFVGRHLVADLEAAGHATVSVGRRTGVDIADRAALARTFRGCDAVVHLAGINRESGDQTYQRIHVDGTAAVVAAAQQAGVGRLVFMSFLRARPDGPSAYHRSKWTAEELVRPSTLSWTILKCGVTYGRGDHLLDHVSRALRTVPVFGQVGLRDHDLRPVAVADVVRILAAAALGDRRLDGATVAVVGPERLSLGAAVRRVARVIGRPVLVVPMPVAIHRWLARAWEWAMPVPLVSRAQVEILAEGVTDPMPTAVAPPTDLVPATPFTTESIAAGLPDRGAFGASDLRWSRR